ncbi:glycosyltransferase family 2 protein [Segatella copri]|uniref:Glycosyltransferase n=1 Tax=Segatella copri TaxID=165179 RepID=A0AAW5ULN1_9BACT|nr:glycosyltransferase family 2 protein [Segatella copri]MCW4111801.1 glycosyltransferase [Segatella copri]MCW4121990.1 glycosyltransferase [Segatella copri]MCW4155759.1 glycosyltransferase [Segatella copri]
MLEYKMVSIIIATYNSEKTLKRALDSVLNQSFQDWECIVVDGASKDGTIDIVKEFVSKDSRFRYVSEPDKGIYDAFNKGWKMAKAEWVMYLGSDDEYLRDGIAQLVYKIDDNDIVYGDVVLKYNNGKEKLQKSKDYNVLEDMVMPCCHQALVMRRNAIAEMDGFDESFKIIADKDLICKSYFAKLKFKQMHIPVAKFYIGGISQSSFDSVFESYRITQKYYSKFYSYMFLWKSLILKFLVLLKHRIEEKYDI